MLTEINHIEAPLHWHHGKAKCKAVALNVDVRFSQYGYDRR
jgi:hypothetical protein